MDSKMKRSWEGLGVILANLGGLGGHFRVILAVLAALEGLLERLGLVLGRLEGILDGLGGILGASWRSGKRLGNVLGAILASLGSHFVDVCSVLGRKTCKRGKISLSRGLPILTSILE